MKIKFVGTIKDGRIKLKHADVFNRIVAGYEPGTEVALTIDKNRGTRSENENKYYWAVVVKTLADHLGFFPEEMHDALKMKFLLKESKPIPTTRSTASLDTKEFEDFLEKVRMWASSELEVKIPLPNEVDFEE